MTASSATTGAGTSRRRRHATAIFVAFTLGASLAGGIALAAPPSAKPLHACANTKGVLRVLKANGHCPARFSAVTLNRRGLRGATGSKGKLGHTGPRGPNGLSGAGAASSVVAEANGKGVIRKGPLVPIGGTSLRLQAQCLAGRTTWSRVAILGGDHYLVRGFSHFTIADGATATAHHQNIAGVTTATSIPVNAHVFGYSNSYANTNAVSDLKVNPALVGKGVFSANVLAVDGHTTFTIAVYLAASNQAAPSTCRATAQVTAAH